MEPDWAIVNVVPGDYNNDGKLDVLIMMKKAEESTSDIEMRVHLGSYDDKFNETILIPPAISVQPIVLDAFGEMKNDLIGYPAEHPGNVYIWRNIPDQPKRLFEL